MIPSIARTRGPSGPGASSGQALVETLLITMVLVMVIAAVLQIFLIDNRTFELVTSGHQRLLALAYRTNRPGLAYRTREVALSGALQRVPVVRYFRLYGLPPELQIRSTIRPGPKRLTIGSGTRADLAAGLTGSVSGVLERIRDGRALLDRANRIRAQTPAPRRP